MRRNRLNVGTCRSTSSAISAGDASIVSLVTTLTLAGMSPSRCSVRVGVTVTVSSSAAGASVDVDRRATRSLDALRVFSAKPPARHDDRDVAGRRRLDGEAAVRSGRHALLGARAARTMTAAPETTPPLESWTTPEIEVPPEPV